METNVKNQKHVHHELVISPTVMRRSVGILGMALPFILLIGSLLFGNCHGIQQSISNYYHTNMRDILVGILCAVSFFLMAYLGYDSDYIAFRFAGLFALGIAFFPMNAVCPLPDCNIPPFHEFHFVNYLHLGSAVLFFLTLSYISIFLFTKTYDNLSVKGQKKKRNVVYVICGIVMITSMFLLLLFFLFVKGKVPKIENLKPVFWLETIALIAFGISWLVKGDTIFKDKPNEKI